MNFGGSPVQKNDVIQGAGWLIQNDITCGQVSGTGMPPTIESSLHFVFIVPYEWAHWARVFVTGKPVQPSFMRHSSLLGQFVGYE
jgi:hypothetical protein